VKTEVVESSCFCTTDLPAKIKYYQVRSIYNSAWQLLNTTWLSTYLSSLLLWFFLFFLFLFISFFYQFRKTEPFKV